MELQMDGLAVTFLDRFAVGTALALTLSPLAIAQSAPSASSDTTIIVTGTREAAKKARDSLAPIDVVSAGKLQAAGPADLRDQLSELVPSVTRQAAAYDTGALTDAIQLRGLSPDETLVLVNGKRRHTTANIDADVGPLQGSTPVDLDLIPESAIDHIEVLRDGASAQYGSDAIAGVVNVILKSDAQGGSLAGTTGAYERGDGFTTNLSADYGHSLGQNGFINVSGEFNWHNFSNVSGADPEFGNRVDTRVLGDPESTRELFGFNAGLTTGGGAQVYAFGTYGHRNAQSWENFRNPSEDYSEDGATLSPIYPNGFAPAETISENDYSLTAGIKGDDLAGWHWDVSSTIGGDDDSIGVVSSGNSSLYVDTGYTPTRFHVADFGDLQWTNNIDVSRPVQTGLWSAPVNVALGVEQRLDGYHIGQGDPDSYYTSSNVDVADTYTSGSQGYEGIAPNEAGNHYRNSVGVYIDLATSPIDKLHTDLAGRFEHYSDFGNALTGKVSLRYDLTPQWALRGTASTGFRAPTLAQEYFTSLNVGEGYASAQLAEDSAAAEALGAQKLKPETSHNFSAGLVGNPVRNLQLAVDLYQINIYDRIVDGALYSDSDTLDVSGTLAGHGYTIPGGTYTSAQYYVNGADTRTRGLDFTLSYKTSLGDYGQINWDAAVNFNQTAITRITDNSIGEPNLDQGGISYLTTATPHNRETIGGTWYDDKFSLGIHENRYGHVMQEDLDQIYYEYYYPTVIKSVFTTNLNLGYDLTSQLHLSAGADNLFNVYPSKTNVLALSPAGWNTYDTASPFGFNGGYYYGGVSYKF